MNEYTPGFIYRRFLRGADHQHYGPTRDSYYGRCHMAEDFTPEYWAPEVNRPDEQDARHVGERLSLLLNQAGAMDIYVSYTTVDDQAMYLVSWEEDGHSYGLEVSADADGVWDVGSLYEEKEVDDTDE